MLNVLNLKKMNELNPELLKKYYRRKTLALIGDIILIIFFIFLTIYVVKNIEYAKSMQGDVCKICEDKTGAKCILGFVPSYSEEQKELMNKTEADKLIP